MKTIPQHIKRFALNTFYGIRQWLLQYILYLMANLPKKEKLALSFIAKTISGK
jgi:hypothetical protein